MKRTKSKITIILATTCILSALLASGFLTNNAVNTYTDHVQSKDRICVVIDAGHGGIDGGAVSCTGVKESNINLEIALRLNDLLHLLGIRTYMIRTEDISVYTSGNSIAAKKVSDLKERVRIINQTQNALLISIHQNNFDDARYSGAQVFYNTDSSLATKLQNTLVKILNPGSKRKIKKADSIYLMQRIECPGYLIECGFLSNCTEEALLRDPSYQLKLCSVIASVLSCNINNSAVA